VRFPFVERRKRLGISSPRSPRAHLFSRSSPPRLDDPQAAAHPPTDNRIHESPEGLMLKRWDSVSPGPAKRPLVSMESADPHIIERGADVCAARARKAFVLLFRLHFWGLGRSGGRVKAGAVGKAYFGPLPTRS